LRGFLPPRGKKKKETNFFLSEIKKNPYRQKNFQEFPWRLGGGKGGFFFRKGKEKNPPIEKVVCLLCLGGKKRGEKSNGVNAYSMKKDANLFNEVAFSEKREGSSNHKENEKGRQKSFWRKKGGRHHFGHCHE